jgi:hypothetical protein
MLRTRTWLGLLAVALLVGWLAADDKKEPPPAKLRPGWERIGLSADQVEKIAKVQGDYRPKVEALEKQLKALQDEQLAKETDVLTEAQKARLKDLEAAKDPTKP